MLDKGAEVLNAITDAKGVAFLDMDEDVRDFGFGLCGRG